MASGFSVPDYEATRIQIVDNYHKTFGQNANSASDTVDGLLIDTRTLFQTRHYEAVGAAYDAHFFSTAQGLELDALLDLFGATRLPPAGSVAETIIYGTAGTTVLQESTASTIDTSSGFEVDEDEDKGSTASGGTDSEAEDESDYEDEYERTVHLTSYV